MTSKGSASAPQDQTSLWDPFGRADRRDLLRLWADDRFVAQSWAEWWRQGASVAGSLRRRGLARGERVACVITNDLASLNTVLGVWMAGGTLVSLPVPARGMVFETYLTVLRRMALTAEAEVLCLSPAMASVLGRYDLGIPCLSTNSLTGPVLGCPDPLTGRATVFIQFSSGTSREPTGCALSADAIAAQLRRLASALAVEALDDVTVSWLPLSHDMGLFGGPLLSYWTGHRFVGSSPQRFLGAPETWMADCAAFGATMSPSPPFGLELAARSAARLPPNPIPMRRLVVGGDYVRHQTLRRACDALGPHRLPWSSLAPAYGLAEAVLAVSVTPATEAPTVITVDAEMLAGGSLKVVAPDARHLEATTTLVSAGKPLEDTTVRVDEAGGVGEVTVTGPSIATGYVGNRRRAAERFVDGGLRTGDLGFLDEGRLYISGRSGDLLVVGGRNIYATDIELALDGIGDLRSGCFAIVDRGVDDATGVFLVAELRDGHRRPTTVASDVIRCAVAECGATVHGCLFVGRGELPKTPSGKVQRGRCRDLLRSRSDEILAVVPS